MPAFRTGTVTAIRSEREGLQRVEVDARPAYVLTQLVGPVVAGDRVVVNTTAVDLGLGTGGWDVVHWNLTREAWSSPGPGHVMKLRYTSLQTDTGVAEERDDYVEPDGLGGMAVVVCGLHSQLAAVAGAFKHAWTEGRLLYVMTDVAALPIALSDLVAALRDRSLLDATVTAGHAFGGDHEAVNVPSALRVARAAGADTVVVAPGPGGVGTDTRFGFGGLEVASIIEIAAADGGRPIVALRWSDADGRDRHRGLSHHSRTVLELTSGASVAYPAGETPPSAGDHEYSAVDVPDLAELLGDLGVTTMGRRPDEEHRFFAYAAAAGVLAAERCPP